MNNINSLNLFGQYTTKTFTDIWSDLETFTNDLQNCSLTVSLAEKAETLFLLFYGEYGNSSIAYFDENQFKYKFYSLLYQYGNVYFRRREVQEAIIALDINSNDVLSGTKAIYNTAQNPSTTPSTDSLTELTYIDSQNTTNYLKTKLTGYSEYLDLITKDETKEFLNKFKDLFIKVVTPQYPLLYPEIE